MSLHIFVFCDRCSEGQTVGGKIRRGEGRGWCDGDREYAAGLGWARQGDQDVCPECQDEARP